MWIFINYHTDIYSVCSYTKDYLVSLGIYDILLMCLLLLLLWLLVLLLWLLKEMIK